MTARGVKGGVETYPKPFRALGTETKTFETQTNTGLTMIVLVRFFVAFLIVGGREGKL